jgi:hypothetical protein
LELSDDEREQLSRWARRRKSSQALARRSRIVLECARGLDNKPVAARLGCHQVSVGKWRARFVAERPDGLVTQDLLQRSAHRSVQAIERDLRAWVAAWNDNPKAFTWAKSPEQIRASLKRLLAWRVGLSRLGFGRAHDDSAG